MKSTPDAITSAKLFDTVTGQAWVITPYTTQRMKQVTVSEYVLRLTDEASRSFQILMP